MITKYKANFLQQYFPCQLILLDTQGILLQSCNTFFDVTQYYGKSASEHFEFLESLQEIFKDLNETFYLPRIELNLENISGVYDFYFFKDKEIGKDCILWYLKDISQENKHLFQVQQEGRETGIEKEMIDLQKRLLIVENSLLEQKNSELERATAFKNKFFSQVSHELRSPINGILGLSDLLAELSGDLQQTEFIAGIQASSKHLKNVVNDILDISKIEAGKLTFEYTSFSLREIFKNLELAFFAETQTKNIHFTTHINTQIPAVLYGDATRLTQIFYNLLGNAFKFTEKGTVSLNASWLPSENTNTHKILFQVSDTGIGIPENKLKYIFDPYLQGSESTYRNFGGTGLGLAVVKQLVELQKGQIWVESDEKKGTVFSFILDFEVKENIKEMQPDYSGMYFYNLKTLVADDNAINLLYTKKLLQEVGLEVTLARDGKEAIELLEKEHFDIIFCDLQMPQIDGFGVIDFIRNTLQKNSQEMPIVMLTGSTDSEESKNELRQKANALIFKPFQRQELYEVLRKILNKHQSKRLFNLKELERVTFGEKQFMLDMLESTLKNTPLDLEQMLISVGKRDLEDVSRLCHKIKPVASLIGSIEFRKNLEQIEKLCKTPSNQYPIEVLVNQTLDLYQKIAEQLTETKMNLLADI
jgi:signal transduction histidine kinase/DNA-binding response OmpR family regulator